VIREKGPSIQAQNETIINLSTPSFYAHLLNDLNQMFWEKCNYVKLFILKLPKISSENPNENIDSVIYEDEFNNFNSLLEKLFKTKLLSIDIWDIIS
jgi:hypothetical protein